MRLCRQIAICLICLGLASSLAMDTFAQARTLRIGMVYDGKNEYVSKTIGLVHQEIANITQGAHRVEFPENCQIGGNYDLGQINLGLDRLLESKQVDLVLALGEVTTNEVCSRKVLPKPVIAAGVIDAKTQLLPVQKGVSGVNNLNYINTFSNFDRAFQAFVAIVPFYRVVVLADEFHLKSIPRLKILERRLANEFSMEIKVIPVDTEIGPALEQIPDDAEAVFVSILPRIGESERKILVDTLIKRKLPSFSFQGRPDVEAGMLTSIIPEARVEHLTRSIAINVQEFLDGTNPGDLQTYFALGEKPSINLATARAIGVYPGWSILTEADLINEEDQGVDRVLDIDLAVKEALEANLDLAAAERQVSAGIHQVDEARSFLLPQLNLGTDARIIDDDRAAASLGTAPERAWTGSVRASQILYSDKAWAGYDIEKYSQVSREKKREGVELDIIQAAAVAYLSVLKAESIKRIQKDNLKLTRENLERAQIRVSIGSAGPEEVYRWESQIAESRRQVLNSESASLDAATRMNQVLNRPLGERFMAREKDYKEPLDVLSNRRMLAYLDNPQELNAMKDFLVVEGLEFSPELQQLDASISALERSIALAKREFWVPMVALVGNVTETFEKGGEGASAPSVLSGLNLPSANDTDWSAGVSVSLPLYSGGSRSAVLKKNLEELSGLKYRRMSAANSVEQRILNAVYLIRASYPGIRLTFYAADSAKRNLTLVTDSYVRGIKSIIDLIDAQNRSLVADQEAANAVYNFLIDLMTVQRSLGQFFLFSPREEQLVFMDRLDTFMVSRGFTPLP